MNKQKPGCLKVLGITIFSIFLIFLTYACIREIRREALYQHAFRLLEEQTASYLTEHYSGITKIEFSPIIIDDSAIDILGISETSQYVVPIVYDEHGNRALLGVGVGRFFPEPYGHPGKISYMTTDDGYGHNLIEMRTPKGDRVDLTDYQHLPESAKFQVDESTDDNIELLLKDKQLESVKKDSSGSPKAKIHYDLRIQKWAFSKWR